VKTIQKLWCDKGLKFTLNSLIMKHLFISIFLTLLIAVMVQHAGAQKFSIDSSNRIMLLMPGRHLILPAFSFRLNDTLFSAASIHNIHGFPLQIKVAQLEENVFNIEITNTGTDTVELSNLVPVGETDSLTYITATGPWALARARLFRPGFMPVSVTLPDNNWDLGYASLRLSDEKYFAALIKRKEIENGHKHRYKTVLFPGGKAIFDLNAVFGGPRWQDVLTLVFRDKKLFIANQFDNSLYERPDLQWIRDAYLIMLRFAWDKEFYDWKKRSYQYYNLLNNPGALGSYDVIGLWPTWPRLGADERNQWDLYRDMPGGLEKLNNLAAHAHQQNTRFFIAYNPWDKSTRKENPYKAMASLIKETNADGVVLDTRGKSSYELQKAADSMKGGVVMYSEGMAIVEDMPGIISGRVHDAIYLQPQLNMNKIIKPDFSIFRVCQLADGNIHRETAISFFNGYGTEINTFAPGRPEWIQTEYEFLGKTLMVLRQNSLLFKSNGLVPLIDTYTDSIWVNQWQGNCKTLYTILSFKPEGFNGPLFSICPDTNYHIIDLWNHVVPELCTVPNAKTQVKVLLEGYPNKAYGTREEGAVSCIALLKTQLFLQYHNDSLMVKSTGGNKILIWPGNPSYKNQPLVFDTTAFKVFLYDSLTGFEGKVVIQLFDEKELLDEQIVIRNLRDHPVLVSGKLKTKPGEASTKGMALIPATSFVFYATPYSHRVPMEGPGPGATHSIQPHVITNTMYLKILVPAKPTVVFLVFLI